MIWLTMLVSGAAAAGSEAIDLRWSTSDCPSEAAMAESLAALGLRISDDGDLTVRARDARPNPDPSVPQEVEMVVARGSRMIARSITLQGTCEERAAVAAAVIERAIQPLLMPAPAPEAAPPPPEPPRELRPAAKPSVKVGPDAGEDARPSEPEVEDKDEEEVNRDLTLEEREPIWMVAGALVVLGGEGPTFRGGADAEVRYEMTEDLFAVLRMSYRTPRVEYVGAAEIRMDDGAAALGVQVGAPWDALALQATAVLQVAWAHANGLAQAYNAVRANPGITVGGCYQKEFGGWGIEACVRGFGFLRRQEIHVNNQLVVELPRVGGEISVGVAYQL